MGKYCGAGGSDYQNSKPKSPNQIRKPKGFCKDGKEIVTMLCSGFEKGRHKCDDLKKSLKKECGSEGSDYQDSKPKGFCIKIGNIIKGHCSTPEDREKNKCDGHENLLRNTVAQGLNHGSLRLALVWL